MLELLLHEICRRFEKVSHRLMPFVRYPERGEFASTRQLGQFHRMAPVRFHLSEGAAITQS
jgi:hypothetical protein